MKLYHDLNLTVQKYYYSDFDKIKSGFKLLERNLKSLFLEK